MSCLAFYILLPLLIVGAAIYWLTETTPQRARRWHAAGASQRAIAERLGVSRYRVRTLLAT